MGQSYPTGIKSIQRGVVSLNSVTTGASTISSVVTAKTELRNLGFFSSGTGVQLAQISLTNPTTITALCTANAANQSVSWELTEYY
jgi:hypothetical protein